MAESAPLLREYGVCSSIEGSNPSLPATSFPRRGKLNRNSGLSKASAVSQKRRERLSSGLSPTSQPPTTLFLCSLLIVCVPMVLQRNNLGMTPDKQPAAGSTTCAGIHISHFEGRNGRCCASGAGEVYRNLPPFMPQFTTISIRNAISTNDQISS